MVSSPAAETVATKRPWPRSSHSGSSARAARTWAMTLTSQTGAIRRRRPRRRPCCRRRRWRRTCRCRHRAPRGTARPPPRRHRDADAADLVRHGLAACFVEVVDDDARASGREVPGQCRADPAPGTGDDHPGIAQRFHGVSFGSVRPEWHTKRSVRPWEGHTHEVAEPRAAYGRTMRRTDTRRAHRSGRARAGHTGADSGRPLRRSGPRRLRDGRRHLVRAAGRGVARGRRTPHAARRTPRVAPRPARAPVAATTRPCPHGAPAAGAAGAAMVADTADSRIARLTAPPEARYGAGHFTR